MKVLFTLFALVITQSFWAQQEDFGIEYTPGGHLDYVFDHFGNQYSFEDIAISNDTALARTTYTTCTSGYFQLHFTVGSGMIDGEHPAAAARRDVLCRVFYDISQMIQSPLTTNGSKVNIWVRNITNLPNYNSNMLGVASGFYNVTQTNNTTNPGGIVDNEIWKTINSGTDSYVNVIPPIGTSSDASGNGGLYYHGMVAINPNQNWHTNLSSNASSPNVDLYTVALHEVVHALGFVSLINSDGQSRLGTSFNYYNRYDLQLRNSATPPLPLITNIGACNTMYDYTFTGQINSLDPGLCSDTVSGDQPTDCATTIRFGQNLIPVYRPLCYQTGSSLSHFEDICYPVDNPQNNNQYFVMSNANSPGVNKRFLKPEERQVLCEIGYSLSNSYGNNSAVAGSYHLYPQGSCSNGQLAGINDGIQNSNFIFTGNVGDTIYLPNLLSNDPGAMDYECLQVAIGAGTITNPSGTASTIPTYTPTENGLHLLRYIPKNGSKKGNITYVFVNVALSIDDFNCNNSQSICNMVNNGGFEEAIINGPFDNTTLSCWHNFSNSPDLFASNNPLNTTNTSSFSSWITAVNTYSSNPPVDSHDGIADGNFNFIGLHNHNGNLSESTQTVLNNPLLPNTSYVLTFWARVKNEENIITSNISFFSLPNFIGTTLYQNGLNANLFTTTYPNSFDIANVNVPNDVKWHFYSIPFTFTGTVPQNSLVIAKRNNNPNTFTQYIFIDDVSIIQVGELTELSLPDTICHNQTLNLENYLTPAPPGGTFTGPGVNGSTFNATTAGVGNHTITYTYNNNVNCPVTISDTIIVNPTITPIFRDLESTICQGQNYALPTISWNGISGTWSPIFNSQNVSTTVYTFTPDPGQGECINSITHSITIVPYVTPTFNQIQPICQGQSFVLPEISNDSTPIYGTWSPAINTNATTTYTFTPLSWQCANQTTMTVEIINGINAVNDNFSNTPINTFTGGSTPSVFTNDLVGSFTANSSNVNVSFISVTPSITPLPTINANGIIHMPIGTPMGTYVITYKITHKTCTNLSSIATATVVMAETVVQTPVIQPGIRANSVVSCIDTQSNGKIIIGGVFTAYNNINRKNFAILSSNLTLDTSTQEFSGGTLDGNTGYNPLDLKVIKNTGTNYNKIIVVGWFDRFNGGSYCKGITRLNPDGTPDYSFNVSQQLAQPNATRGADGRLYACYIIPDGLPNAGKILIGGIFKEYNGYPAKNFALLNADGTLDIASSFNNNINTVIPATPPTWASPSFSSLPYIFTAQSDGKILVGGYFDAFNGVACSRFLRLNTDGTLDTSFNNNLGSGALGTDATLVSEINIQTNGRIVIGGEFTKFSNQTRNGIARLLSTGLLDNSITFGTGFNLNDTNPNSYYARIRSFAYEPNPNGINQGFLFVGGELVTYQGQTIPTLIKINLDNSSRINIGSDSPNGHVWALHRQTDGKVIIGGKFTHYGTSSALNITRIAPLGGEARSINGAEYWESEPEIDLFAEKLENILLYPNPSTGEIFIEYWNKNQTELQIEVYSLQGQLLHQTSSKSQKERLDLKHLAKGSYLVKIKSATETVTKTIILH